MTRRKKQKRSVHKKSRQKRAVSAQPTAPLAHCALCGAEAHQGDSQETLASLAQLDDEAAVYYDRDLATVASVAELCGPRFRQNSVGLYAHYGSPAGSRYIVYQWKRDESRWDRVVDSVLERGRLRNVAPVGG